jgi:hypothetical protein
VGALSCLDERSLIKGYFWRCAVRECGHVFGLLSGQQIPLALMLSAKTHFSCCDAPHSSNLLARVDEVGEGLGALSQLASKVLLDALG